MSDESENNGGGSKPTRGPVMIAATKIIKAPPTRVGKIGNNVTLPRTVALKTLVAGAGGAVAGLILGAIFSFQTAVVTTILGGFAGVALVSWSPVKGETLFQYFGVQLMSRARQRKLQYGGDTVAVYVGVARLHRVALGNVHMVPGAINVQPDQVDDRGVLRAEKNRNLLPPRPHVTERPQFTPLYDSDLPQEMVAAMGAGVDTSRRVEVPGQDLSAPPVAPPRMRDLPDVPVPQVAPAASPERSAPSARPAPVPEAPSIDAAPLAPPREPRRRVSEDEEGTTLEGGRRRGRRER